MYLCRSLCLCLCLCTTIPLRVLCNVVIRIPLSLYKGGLPPPPPLPYSIVGGMFPKHKASFSPLFPFSIHKKQTASSSKGSTSRFLYFGHHPAVCVEDMGEGNFLFHKKWKSCKIMLVFESSSLYWAHILRSKTAVQRRRDSKESNRKKTWFNFICSIDLKNMRAFDRFRK